MRYAIGPFNHTDAIGPQPFRCAKVVEFSGVLQPVGVAMVHGQSAFIDLHQSKRRAADSSQVCHLQALRHGSGKSCFPGSQWADECHNHSSAGEAAEFHASAVCGGFVLQVAVE